MYMMINNLKVRGVICFTLLLSAVLLNPGKVMGGCCIETCGTPSCTMTGSCWDCGGTTCCETVCTCDGSCFPAGTKVSIPGLPDLQPDGVIVDEDPGFTQVGEWVKNIEDIQVGDRVVSQDEGGRQVVSTVTELKTPISTNMCEITYTDGDTLRLTDNHAMSTVEGWKAINPEAARAEIPGLSVGQLEDGDEILRVEGGSSEVESYSCWSERQQTYNLKLEGGVNTYFADGYLAHNKGGQFCPDGYHQDKTVCVWKCKTVGEECGFNARGKYRCEDIDECYCSSDYPCVPDACTDATWSACTATCGGGTETSNCGTVRACNTQSCCTPVSPTAPVLTNPANGSKRSVLTTTLTWNVVNFGTNCSGNNNQYMVYVDTNNPPSTLRYTGTNTSYVFTGTVDRRYYWQVVASNGSGTTSSVVRSFYTPGLVTGTLFDASEIDTCVLMGGEPKISGATVNLISGSNSYSPTTSGLGIYSSYVVSPDSYTVSPVVGDPYTGVAKLVCQGTSADFLSSGATITRDFGFWRIYGGWWQAVGGDVYGGGGIESVIPNSLPANEKYLVKEDADGADGLVYYDAGGEVVLGEGSNIAVSSSGWESESGYEGQDINYAYYMAKMKTLGKTVWDGSSEPSYSPVDDYEVYTHTGNITINYDFNVDSDEKRIYMVDGDVVVDRAVITVALGSHLTLIASGTITFTDNVGEIHGWWMGDRIVIASTGDTATEVQFIGEGSFIGWSSIEFGRDRGVTNNTAPAEEFTYRPDFMVNAPDALKFSKYKWMEQTP